MPICIVIPSALTSKKIAQIGGSRSSLCGFTLEHHPLERNRLDG